jgi:hypothetical protein
MAKYEYTPHDAQMVSTPTSGNKVFPTKAVDGSDWDDECYAGYEPIEDPYARYGNGVD